MNAVTKAEFSELDEYNAPNAQEIIALILGMGSEATEAHFFPQESSLTHRFSVHFDRNQVL